MARLERVSHIREARVDWTGKYFLLSVDSPQDVSAAEQEAISILGKGARRLTQAKEKQHIQNYLRGEPWLKPGETLRMSKEEARVLAERFVSRAAKEADLDEKQRIRLTSALHEELLDRFERFHRGESSLNRFREEWPQTVDRALERAANDVTSPQRQKVREALLDALNR